MYRYIKYEFDKEADLEDQLNGSLAQGIHTLSNGGTITIVDSCMKMDKVIYSNAQKVKTGTTHRQLKEINGND